MPDAESPATETPTLFAPRAALRLGAALLVGFAAVLAFTIRDAGRVGELERFEQVTAVGDTNYYVVPTPPPTTPIVQWQGRAWAAVDFVKQDLRDTQMLRIGCDEASGLALYRPRAAPKPDELFVKRDTDSFYRLHPAP